MTSHDSAERLVIRVVLARAIELHDRLAGSIPKELHERLELIVQNGVAKAHGA